MENHLMSEGEELISNYLKIEEILEENLNYSFDVENETTILLTRYEGEINLKNEIIEEKTKEIEKLTRSLQTEITKHEHTLQRLTEENKIKRKKIIQLSEEKFELQQLNQQLTQQLTLLSNNDNKENIPHNNYDINNDENGKQITEKPQILTPRLENNNHFSSPPLSSTSTAASLLSSSSSSLMLPSNGEHNFESNSSSKQNDESSFSAFELISNSTNESETTALKAMLRSQQTLVARKNIQIAQLQSELDELKSHFPPPPPIPIFSSIDNQPASSNHKNVQFLVKSNSSNIRNTINIGSRKSNYLDSKNNNNNNINNLERNHVIDRNSVNGRNMNDNNFFSLNQKDEPFVRREEFENIKEKYFYALVIGIKLSFTNKFQINLNADSLYDEAKNIPIEIWDQWIFDRFQEKQTERVTPKRTHSVVSNLRKLFERNNDKPPLPSANVRK